MKQEHIEHNWLYRKTEPFFVWVNTIYTKGLKLFLRNRFIAILLMFLMLAIILVLGMSIPSEMAPLEDRSQIIIMTRVPEGATYEFYRDWTESIGEVADSIVPDRKSNVLLVRSDFGFVRLFLKNVREREQSQMDIAALLSGAIRKKTDARAFVQQQSTFGGQRASMPVQYVLQAQNFEKLQEFLPKFMDKVLTNPLFQQADVNLKFNKPENRVIINRDKVATLGLSIMDISQTLQYALSGQRLGYFYMNGKQYQILAEINRQNRNAPTNLSSIYVKNKNGEMIQLSNFCEFVEDVAPPQLYRYNRFAAATVSAGLSTGVTIGQALDEMDKIAKETLDETFRTALSGDSKEYRESSDSIFFAFGLALIFIFLILSAQFESFKDPLIIMFTVPLALAGALIFMYFGDITLNIFSEIGIIMLIGLVVKNGILIVEFANQRQDSGLQKLEAIIEAAAQRLRPILMTSLATVLGILPLVFASGEGANGRIAMGTAVVGGMLLSTFLTIFIVPTMYMIIATERKRLY